MFSRTFQISFAGKTTYQFEEVFSISFQKRCIADSYCVRATVIINDIKWEHVTTKRDVSIMFFYGEAPAVQCFLSLFKYLPSLKLLASLKKYLMSLQKRCVADSYWYWALITFTAVLNLSLVLVCGEQFKFFFNNVFVSYAIYLIWSRFWHSGGNSCQRNGWLTYLLFLSYLWIVSQIDESVSDFRSTNNFLIVHC